MKKKNYLTKYEHIGAKTAIVEHKVFTCAIHCVSSIRVFLNKYIYNAYQNMRNKRNCHLRHLILNNKIQKIDKAHFPK